MQDVKVDSRITDKNKKVVVLTFSFSSLSRSVASPGRPRWREEVHQRGGSGGGGFGGGKGW